MGILGWGFRSNIKIHQSGDEGSATLSLKDKGTIKFSQFIKQDLPILDESQKLWLNPLLFNGTLQTLYYTSMDSSNKFLIYYGRELFTYSDGGICSLDWVIPKPEDEQKFETIRKETLPEGSLDYNPVADTSRMKNWQSCTKKILLVKNQLLL